MDLVVAGRAFIKGRLVEAEVGIAGGRIARIAKSLPSSEARGARRLRLARGVLLPGAVDAHVHLREPGLEHKETIASGTLAALHGGVTTVLEMPNTTPPVATREAFEAKRARFEASAVVDWGLHAMVDASLGAFALGGAPVGYKAYLGGSTHAPGLPPERLAEACALAHRVGRPLVVHAEHPARLVPGAGEDWRAHGAARPSEAERDGIAAVAQAAGQARVLVAHCTTAKGLALARKAGLATEACPHHLLLDDRALRDQGPLAKVNPPLRGPKERAALWKAFAQGKVDHLASDHAPHLLAEKAQGFAEAPSGMPGVETLLPLMLAKVKARAVGLGTVVKGAAENPARFFGLPKGRIAEGFDADLVHVDLAQVRPVRAEDLHSKAGWTCFEGLPAVWPRRVVLRGEVALDDGEAWSGRGREVRPGR
jgi:dihydroorotase